MKGIGANLVVAFLAALALFSCRKDEVVIAPITSQGTVECGTRDYVINVDSIHNADGFIEWPVCSCDTLNFSLINFAQNVSLLEWTVFDTIIGPIVHIAPISDLTINQPDPGMVMMISFYDSLNDIDAIFVIFREDDCY